MHVYVCVCGVCLHVCVCACVSGDVTLKESVRSKVLGSVLLVRGMRVGVSVEHLVLAISKDAE